MNLRGTLFSAFIAVFAVIAAGCAAPQSAKHDPLSISPDFAVKKTLAGSYLAGLHAQRAQDWGKASKYMSEAIDLDGNNEMLTHRGFLLALGAGDMNESRELAHKILESDESEELAIIFLTLDALVQDNPASAALYLGKLPETGFGRYTKPLLVAWTEAAAGNFQAGLDALPRTEDGMHITELYDLHAGLLNEFAGYPEEAHQWFMRATMGELSTRSILAIGNFYERSGHTEAAAEIYSRLQASQPGNTYMNQAINRVNNGLTAPKPFVRSPADGVGMAMFDLAAMLFEKRAYDSALVFTRLAQHAQPESGFVYVMLGDVMSSYGRYDEALANYRKVRGDTDLFLASRLRIAETMEMSGRLNDAIGVLYRLSERDSLRTDALMYIGDLYRRNEQFNEAVAAYDKAVAGIREIQPQHWPLIYARGIALERTNNWPRAEKDLVKALEFQPENPLILNYLGYSWADKGQNLDRALGMVQKAVSLRPNDGYIVDSFGWVLYKMGEFEKSVLFLERAVELVPNDPIVNDHLGDAYWRVDRKLEAEFQWQRAYGLAKDVRFKQFIRAKIVHGLPEEKLIDTSISLD